MENNIKKRVLSYVLDILIISFFIFLLGLCIPKSDKEKAIDYETSIIISDYVDHKIDFSSFFTQYSELQYEKDIENRKEIVLNLGILILYFIVISIILNQTIGMKLLKIHNSSFERRNNIIYIVKKAFIIYGVGYIILMGLLPIFLSRKVYFLGVSILGIIQISLVIFSYFMIRYKREKALPNSAEMNNDKVEVKYETVYRTRKRKKRESRRT